MFPSASARNGWDSCTIKNIRQQLIRGRQLKHEHLQRTGGDGTLHAATGLQCCPALGAGIPSITPSTDDGDVSECKLAAILPGRHAPLRTELERHELHSDAGGAVPVGRHQRRTDGHRPRHDAVRRPRPPATLTTAAGPQRRRLHV